MDIGLTPRLQRLEDVLARYVAEYTELERQDPVRAHHLADAIADLRIMISRVRAESLSLPDPTTPRRHDETTRVSL